MVFEIYLVFIFTKHDTHYIIQNEAKTLTFLGASKNNDDNVHGYIKKSKHVKCMANPNDESFVWGWGY